MAFYWQGCGADPADRALNVWTRAIEQRRGKGTGHERSTREILADRATVVCRAVTSYFGAGSLDREKSGKVVMEHEVIELEGLDSLSLMTQGELPEKHA